MPHQPTVVKGKINLSDFDSAYCAGLKEKPTRKLTRAHGKRIGKLQELLYANSKDAVLLVFQGLDASGKDGTIRRVLRFVNPAGVETTNFKVPSAEESAHDFLWRVHQAVPRFGDIGVFNRSHYEAVLVERIIGGIDRSVVRQRYAQIINFERMLVENHVRLLKFYLHLSKEEQAKRLRERVKNPEKRWKFSIADLETRRHWDDYIQEYENMINATSHAAARWRIVPADQNWYRDYVVAAAVAEAMEELHLKWPKPKEDLSRFKIG